MRMQALAVGVLALLTAVGCAQSPSKEAEAKPELSAELTSLILTDAPSDLPNPLFIDFGGKVALLGYALEPTNLAAPGSKISLKLFWRCSSKLAEGYKLYTELVTAGGKRFAVEGGGALRQGLPPAQWEPGKIYIDEVTLTVPEEMEAARFSIVVGLKTDPIAPEEPAEGEAAEAKKDAKKAEKNAEKPATFGAVHLRVLSGPADGKHGGVIATLETGVTPGAKRARAAKDEKRGAGALKRPLPSRLPASAKPRPLPPSPAQ
jgi:hypothetical protein